MKMSTESTDRILQAIQKSPMWQRLNQEAKALYIQEGRFNIPDGEYQALRNMIIGKVMLEDENVKEVVRMETYKALQLQ